MAYTDVLMTSWLTGRRCWLKVKFFLIKMNLDHWTEMNAIIRQEEDSKNGPNISQENI